MTENSVSITTKNTEQDIKKAEEQYNEFKKQESKRNIETLDISKLTKCRDYIFDYEINNIKLEEEKNSITNNTLNSKMYYYDKEHHSDRIINYNNFKDSKIPEVFKPPKNAYTASWVKHLVSKQKRRYQNSEFDLDMTYITDRVIAMGFPSVGMEAMYRNAVNDVIEFFEKKHKGNVKIYNLCLEKDRIYDKKLFVRSKVGLFPSLDHNPCPVKLILDFCVDICLFLILNLDSVAAVHCKAGKGRTGVMICSYLIFSGLCKNSDEALNYYAIMRTTNKKGVTIPSQQRYIKYFETFLKANFEAPYIYLIPKIIKEHLFINGKQQVIKNLLINLKEDERYYTSPDRFRVKTIKIGPLEKEIIPKITIESFTHKIFAFPLNVSSFKFETDPKTKESSRYFFYETRENDYPIQTDIKINVTNGVDFYIWLNLWYSSLEEIDNFLNKDENNVSINQSSNKDLNSKLLKNKANLESLDSKLKLNVFNAIKSFADVKNVSIQKDEEDSTYNIKQTSSKRNKKVQIMENSKDGSSNLSNRSLRRVRGNKKSEEKKIKIEDTLCLNKNGFIIFNEDDMKIANNNKKDIEEIFNDKVHHKTLTSIIKHGSQLNSIISKLNQSRRQLGRSLFDKNNIITELTFDKLDKFKQKKNKFMQKLTVEICYSIE